MPFDQVNFVLPAVETDVVLRVLIEAKARLQDPARWCRQPHYGAAQCAGNTAADVANELGGDSHDVWVRLAAVVPNAPNRRKEESWTTVGEYNDRPTTTHADILALYDRAITARRAELQNAA